MAAVTTGRADHRGPGPAAYPYWWDHVAPPAADEAPLPTAVDVLVVGAGYTGLCAALVTARAGRSTLVLDAEHSGFGCSTRNGGQISTSIKPDYDELCRRYGRERGYAVAREGHNALEWIQGFVADEAIDCDFAVVGRFHGAHSRSAFEQLTAGIGKRPEGLEIPCEVVSRSEQHRVLGTDAYHGGVIYPRHASLHPAKFHRGIHDRVCAAGGRVVGCCAVTGITRAPGGFVVTTARGMVKARDVVIASNGYTARVTPYLRRRVIPIGSYVIATEPLPAGVMDRIMPTDRIVSDTRKVVYYYRPSPDRTRIVFGGRVSASETDTRVSAPRLQAAMTALFPELAGTAVSHSWMGFVAYTFDTLAHTGVHDGMHYAMGYCGSGVSMAGYLGTRTGQKVLGLAEGRTGFDAIEMPTRPLYRGRPWFLPAAVAWYRWRDRLSA